MLCKYHLAMRHSYFGRVKTSLIFLSLVLHRSQLKAHVFHILIKTLRRKTMISISQRVKNNFVTCNAKSFEFCWTSRPNNTSRTLTKWKKHWNWELKIILQLNIYLYLIQKKRSPSFGPLWISGFWSFPLGSCKWEKAEWVQCSLDSNGEKKKLYNRKWLWCSVLCSHPLLDKTGGLSSNECHYGNHRVVKP